MFVVDSQIHIWKEETPDRPWVPGARERIRLNGHREEAFSYEEALQLMDEAGVNRALLLPPSWEGNRVDYSLEAAEKHPDRFGVMARVPQDNEAEGTAMLKDFAQNPHIKGTRLTFHRPQDRNWMIDGTNDWYWPLAEELGIPISELRELIAAIFQKSGLAPGHAADMADVLSWASLRGIDTHGSGLVPTYLKFIKNGVVNLEPDIREDQNAGAVTRIRADRASGPVVLTRAADLAVKTARGAGVAAVGVQRTIHTGAIGYYTNRIAAAGLVGLGFVAGMPNMGYTGVKGAAVATSPLSVAVPSNDHGIVLLDMATATIAMGKIKQHKASGTPLPEGVAATADGTPTTDPALAEMPLPLGGAKGSGMSLAFELLTSVLVGAPILAEVHSGAGEGKKHRQNALLIALDPAAFGPDTDFPAQVDATLVAIKGLPVAEGADGIFVPGERSSAVARQRSEQGVPVSPKVWAELVAAAEELGVALPASATA
jgi:ureidoglycolate dehydrogenase (NAD+)